MRKIRMVIGLGVLLVGGALYVLSLTQESSDAPASRGSLLDAQFAAATPPTPAPDRTVDAIITNLRTALAPPTPARAADVSASTRPAPTSERLPTIAGAPTYQTDDAIRVEWIVPPTISRDGRLRLKVRVLDDSLTLYPDGASDGNGLDVNIVGPSRGGRLSLPRAMYGEILPPAGPGYNWGSLDETEFVADVFDFDFSARTLTLEVLTNPRLASADEIYASLWTNPPRGETPTWVNRERVRLEESRRE